MLACIEKCRYLGHLARDILWESDLSLSISWQNKGKFEVIIIIIMLTWTIFWKPRFEGPWGNSINYMQNQYSLVFHKAYQADLLPKAGFSSVNLSFGVPQVWQGALVAACCVPQALPGAPLPPETSAQGIWEELSWQQQQHNSRDPPAGPWSWSILLNEHTESSSDSHCPAKHSDTAVAEEIPFFPPCFSTSLSQPGFSL